MLLILIYFKIKIHSKSKIRILHIKIKPIFAKNISYDLLFDIRSNTEWNGLNRST